LAKDNNDAVHTVFSLSTLYILPSPATSMELQGNDVLKGLYGMPPFLPALGCAQKAALLRFCARDRPTKHKHNAGDIEVKG
jgi:hypothetical protein